MGVAPTGEDAFRTFAVDPPYAARTIKKMLQKRSVELIEQLAGGYARDWADYRQRIGVIQGLSEAMSICDEMEKQERK